MQLRRAALRALPFFVSGTIIKRVEHVGALHSIARYPVKSMAGQALARVFVDAKGIAGDRRFAFESSGAPKGMHRVSSSQRRALLQFRAHYDDGEACVTTPDGDVFPVRSAALLTHLDASSTWRLTESDTPQTDVRPIAMHTVQELTTLSKEFGAYVDPRRLRSNLVFDLDATLRRGDVLRIGTDVVLELLEAIPRCRFITYDPDAPLASDPMFALMKFLDGHRGGVMGMYARVRTAGEIGVGDPVAYEARSASNKG